MAVFISIGAAMGDDARVLWCGNISERVNSELLRELFMQAGPVEDVNLGKDRDGRQRNYSFVRFEHEESVGYALELLKGTRLFDRTLSLQARNRSQPMRNSPVARHSPVEFPQGLQDNVQSADKMENMEFSDYRLIDDRRGNNLDAKNLSMASLQGNWPARNQFDRNRSHGRYEPYKKMGNDKSKDYDYDHRRNDYKDRNNYDRNNYDRNEFVDDRRNYRNNDVNSDRPRRKNNSRH